MARIAARTTRHITLYSIPETLKHCSVSNHFRVVCCAEAMNESPCICAIRHINDTYDVTERFPLSIVTEDNIYAQKYHGNVYVPVHSHSTQIHEHIV